jgi:hypothetical protein
MCQFEFLHPNEDRYNCIIKWNKVKYNFQFFDAAYSILAPAFWGNSGDAILIL